MNRINLPMAIAVFFFTVVSLVSCLKEQRPVSTNMDFNQLTAHKWLQTNGPDTGYFMDDNGSVRYITQLIRTDTTVLLYNADSTYDVRKFVTEVFNRDTTPYTGPSLAGYMPFGGYHYEGTYSVNSTDSTVVSIARVAGIIMPPIVRKIELLTTDSLVLGHNREGESRYYAVPR